MKKRFLLPLLLFFLPATIIGAAYAGFVYSNKADTKTDTNLGKIDDIKPNFKLDENNYTIYFFPSMQAAKLDYSKYKNGQGLIDEQSIVDAFAASSEKPVTSDTNFNGGIYAWGEWQDSNSSAQIISESGLSNYNQSYRKYYPKKIETHGGPSISIEQFESLSNPYTNGRDYKNSQWRCDFSGWTTSRQSARDGYASQGEYNYFSAFDDLTKIDVNMDDGTISNDKIIFVYPIFTTGKDNNNGDKANNVVRISDSSNNRYFSRVDGGENKTYFYYNNLVINDLSTWSLSFAGLNNLGGWYAEWGDYRNDSSYKLYNKDDKTKSVIKQSGVYNVYVYLQRRGPLSGFDSGTASNSLFTKNINSSLMPLVYEDSFTAPNDYKIYRWDLGTTGNNFWMFVKIEKVYEFRLAGTEGRGFTFDTAGQLYVSHFSSAADATLGGLWKMYYLDNVFMEKGKNNLFTEYTNSSGGKYKIRNTVFSFLPSDESLTTIGKIEQMNSKELEFVNQEEPDSNVGKYQGISTSSFRDIKDNPGDFIKYPENLPNYAPGNNYADFFFASQFKYSGFCKVLIKVDFATSGDHKGKPTSIRVAVAPYLTNVHKVYVYPDETNLVTFRDPETNLIDPENNTTLKAIELTSFEMNANDDYVLNDQEITLRDGSKKMLSDYLANYDVIDHLTNKAIKIGKSYKRHMACWQRTKSST